MIRRRIPGAILLILATVVAAAVSWSQEGDWTGRSEASEHFILYYRPENEQATVNLLPAAEREYGRITDLIGQRPDETIRLYLAVDRQEFRRLTGGAVPEWGIGVAIPARNRIVLIAAGADRRNQSLRQILAHELSHVVLHNALGEMRPPRWLDEGLAMYISHEWKLGRSILVARALLFGSLIPLDEIERVNTFTHPQAGLAYTESFLAVAFIVDRFGEDALQEMIGELARSGDLDLAMGISLGMTYREFIRQWNDEVIRRYNWFSIVSDPFVLWGFMLALFVIVFLLKRRNTRRMMRQWELQEETQEEGWSAEEMPERWTGR
jgi:hypothetical protein